MRRKDSRVPRSQQAISRPALKAPRTTACPCHASTETFSLERKLPESDRENKCQDFLPWYTKQYLGLKAEIGGMTSTGLLYHLLATPGHRKYLDPL